MDVGPLSEATRTLTASGVAAVVADDSPETAGCEPPQPTSPRPSRATSEPPRKARREMGRCMFPFM